MRTTIMSQEMEQLEMGNEKEVKDDPENPSFVTPDLCKAHRETLEAKISGARNTIIVGLSISTAVISIIMYLILLWMK